MVWGVFQDNRGVLHCEKVNEGIQCWTKVVPARPAKRTMFGMGLQDRARPEETLFKTVMLESHYSRKDYTDNAFEPAGEGYTLQPHLRYMRTNKWGPVQVMTYIKDDETAHLLQSKFRRIEPPQSATQPIYGNDRLIELVRLLGEI